MTQTGNSSEPDQGTYSVLDPVPGAAASPVQWIKYLSAAFATRQALAAQPQDPVGPELLPGLLLPSLCQKLQG